MAVSGYFSVQNAELILGDTLQNLTRTEARTSL